MQYEGIDDLWLWLNVITAGKGVQPSSSQLARLAEIALCIRKKCANGAVGSDEIRAYLIDKKGYSQEAADHVVATYDNCLAELSGVAK